MNAPWSPARSGSARDAFAAYVCDEVTAELIRPICVELGWPGEKVNKGGLRNAVQSLSVSASPNILFVDLSESGDPLSDINSLAEVCEPGTVVIAAGLVNDVRLYRDLLSSGIHDYLLKPLSADQLRDAFASAQQFLNAPKHAEHSAERPHLTTAIIGVRGGAGSSMIATSLAWLMSDREQRSTALLDLDIHFGTGALTLDLEPGRGLTDAVENPSRIDGLFIERAMVKASEKLAILSSEAPLNQPLLSDGSAFHQLQEELKSAFEVTIVDLPRNMLVQHPHLVADINTIFVVTDMTLAAARDTIRLLSWLKSNAPQAQVTVVLNKSSSSSSAEITKKDFETSIERKIDFMLPLDSKVTNHAAKLGKTVAEAGKGSKLASVLSELADIILDGAPVTDEEAPAKAVEKSGGSLLSKITSFKPKIGKKAKAEKVPA